MRIVSIFANESNDCGVFSIQFDKTDLERCGVDKEAIDFDEEYVGKNEYQKALELFTRHSVAANKSKV